MCVRPLCSLQRVQSPISARISVETDNCWCDRCVRCDRLRQAATADAPGALPAAPRWRQPGVARDTLARRARRSSAGAPRGRRRRSRAGSGRRGTPPTASVPADRQARGRRPASTAAGASLRRALVDDRHGVAVDVEAGILARHVVGDDHVDALAQALGSCARASTSAVSAANPTSSGRRRPSRLRRDATLRKDVRRRDEPSG